MTVAAREVYDPRLDEIARRLRGRFGGETALRGKGAGGKLRARPAPRPRDRPADRPGHRRARASSSSSSAGRRGRPPGAALLALRDAAPGRARRSRPGCRTGRCASTFDPPIVPSSTGDDLEADVGRAHGARSPRASSARCAPTPSSGCGCTAAGGASPATARPCGGTRPTPPSRRRPRPAAAWAKMAHRVRERG